MNIIEAMQKAENGELITNNFLKYTNSFLKYIEDGVFYQYTTRNGSCEYKYEVREFSMADILSIGWETVPNLYFNDSDE